MEAENLYKKLRTASLNSKYIGSCIKKMCWPIAAESDKKLECYIKHNHAELEKTQILTLNSKIQHCKNCKCEKQQH